MSLVEFSTMLVQAGLVQRYSSSATELPGNTATFNPRSPARWFPIPATSVGIGLICSSRIMARIDITIEEAQVLTVLAETGTYRYPKLIRRLSLKNAGRYGFVLERQCSLAKHYLAFHSKGNSLLQHHVDVWQDTAKSREELPDRIQGLFPPRSRAREPEGIYSSPMGIEDDRLSMSSQLRKARSMDASCVDLSTIETAASRPLTRARSDFHLDQSNPSPVPPMMSGAHYGMRPKSMAVPDDASRRTLARALYAYLSSGENQLSFHEGDIIALIGEKNKGWQYGENLRTQRCGWFPVAYTELLHEEDDSALGYKAVGRGIWRRWLADDPPGHAAPPEPSPTAAPAGPAPASSSPSACPPAAPRATPLTAASKPSPQATAASRPAADAVTVVIAPTPTKEKVGTNSAAAAADASAAASATPLPKPQPTSSTTTTTQPQPHVRFSAHPVLPHPNNHFYTLPNRARSNLASKKTLLRSHGSSSEDSGTSEPKCSSSMYTFPSSTVSPDLISDCPNSRDPATRGVNEKRQSITLMHPLTAAVIEK
ncbi:uncharacterized protein LOC143019361 [Oratosquilla oratoria]|uniref:uncharacterized protein LOC143019361 n=1 Tax=Oratosquilla oratoria TaxID=337810 RepID=UPI003F76A94A